VIPEARVFVLKCNTYLKRDVGDSLRPICPIHIDGLFDGQLKPPYQTDPPELPAELVEAVEVLTTPMPAEQKSYVTGKTLTEECDT
jgi:hypothetical protein